MSKRIATNVQGFVAARCALSQPELQVKIVQKLRKTTADRLSSVEPMTEAKLKTDVGAEACQPC